MSDTELERKRVQTRLQFNEYTNRNIQPDTRARYTKIWHNFIDFCAENGWDNDTDSDTSVMAFFVHLVENEATPSTLATSKAAIGHFFIMQNRADFTETQKFKKFIKGL